MLDARKQETDGSWTDQTAARFNELNAGLVLRTSSFLNDAIADRSRHPRLINTLSLLEHVGSHKIMATQHGAGIDQPTLRHLAEECHHAFFLKRQAEKIADRPLAYVDRDLFAPLAARMYFQRLEASIVRDLPAVASPFAAYLYISMIVEFRAIWFYGLYQQALTRHANPLSLKRLLGEEQNHLTDMAERLERAGELSDALTEAFIVAEQPLYARLLEAMQRSTGRA